MDFITLVSLVLLGFSLVVFYFFARFTVKLIRQHRNIYALLFALEEEEKEKR